MGRAKKRADRIREEIPIQQVLSDYGYRVDAGYNGQQQFSCDLHGDGSDNKPSARVYPDSASWFCFACGRPRDAIQTAKEKEGVDFWAAVRLLEQRYNLPPMYEDDDDADEEEHQRRSDLVGQISAIVDPKTTFDEERKQTLSLLDGLTKDRDLPLEELLRLWEAYDKVVYLVTDHKLSEEQGKRVMVEIRSKALEKIKAVTQ
jgi:DNA primase